MVKTLKPKEIEKLKNFYLHLDPDMITSINNSDWDEVYNRFKNYTAGWAFHGCFWSTLYNIDNDIYKKLGFIPEGAFAYTDINDIDLKKKKKIGHNAFYQSNISEVKLSNKLEEIRERAFCTDQDISLHIVFDGTMKEFRNIKKSSDWFRDRYMTIDRYAYVVCSDGDLEYGGR